MGIDAINGLPTTDKKAARSPPKMWTFLLEAEAADQVHEALFRLGYRCIYCSEDTPNNVRGSEGLNLLYAHRPLARRLLAQASERETPMGRMRVISVEGLIGFKLQAYVNDATRTRDLEDIRTLMKIHRASITRLLCSVQSNTPAQ